MLPVPVQVVVPALFIVREARYLSLLPLMFRLLPMGIVSAPVPFIVPPVQLSVPIIVPVPLSVAFVPSSKFWDEIVPVIVAVPPVIRDTPAPVNTLPAPNPPPPFNLSVPRSTFAVPVLLKGPLMVVVSVPPDLRNVPLLLNVKGVPQHGLSIPTSFCMSSIPLLLKRPLLFD